MSRSTIGRRFLQSAFAHCSTYRVFIALFALAPAGVAVAQGHPGSCAVLPQFTAMERLVAGLDAALGLDVIYRYEADPANDTPLLCEGLALDAMMSVRETALVWLDTPAGRLFPQAASRCAHLVAKPVTCNGLIADMAAFPYTAGFTPFHSARGLSVARLHVGLPQARLLAVYAAEIGGQQSGRFPRRISAPGGYLHVGASMLIVLVDAPAPWHYRKLVWYFDVPAWR